MASERAFGPYRLLRRIAVGGMAEIHLAAARGIGGFEKQIALKMIHQHYSADEHFVQMLIDEAKISVQLQHVNIGQVFDLGLIDETYYITMEYIDGPDLFKILRRASEIDRDVPLEVAVFIAREVCAGLDYAHNKGDEEGKPLGVIHRDISPQNVMVSLSGEVKIVDFGIAKAALRARQTAAGVIKGKYYYMSPEQAWGDPVDQRTDVFSAGILLYEMLTGQMLYLEDDLHRLLDRVRRADIDPPSTIRSGMPTELEEIVMRALCKRPADRWQTAHDFEQALQNFLFTHAKDFTPARLAAFVREVMDEEEPVEVPSTPARVSSQEELAPDKHSVIFRLEDLAEAAGGPPLPKQPGDYEDTDETTINPLPPAPRLDSREITSPRLSLDRRGVRGPATAVTLKRAVDRGSADFSDDAEPTVIDASARLFAMGVIEQAPSPDRVRLPGVADTGGDGGGEARRGGRSAGQPARAPSGSARARSGLQRPMPRPRAAGASAPLPRVPDEDHRPPPASSPPSPAPRGFPPPAPDRASPPSPPSSLPDGEWGPGASPPAAAPAPAGPGDARPTTPPPLAPGGVVVPAGGVAGARKAPAIPELPNLRRPEETDWTASGPQLAPAPPAGVKGGFIVDLDPVPDPVPATPAVPQLTMPPTFELTAGSAPAVTLPVPSPRRRRWLVPTVVAAAVSVVAVVVILLATRTSTPRYGTVQVASVPSGAQVHLDDRIGDRPSPVTVTNVDRQVRHRVRVTLAGYEPWEREFAYDEQQADVQLIAVLQPIVGVVSVTTTPPGALVSLDGRPQGRSPQRIEGLPVHRPLQLELKLAGYRSVERTLKWQGRKLIDVSVALERD